MSLPPIIGLDTDSFGVHAVCLGAEFADQQCIWTFRSRMQDADARRIDACHQFQLFAKAIPEGVHIFCEEPLALKNGKTTRLLGLMAGALWGQVVGHNLWWHWVDVATWKKEVVGKGNVSKEQIQEFVREHLRRVGIPDEYEQVPDLFDAHCLAMYGRRQSAHLKEVM